MQFSCVFLILFVFLVKCALASEPLRQPGFQHLRLKDNTEVGVWYPAYGDVQHQQFGLFEQNVVDRAPVAEGLHPLIVISHGTGGSFASHMDTAMALAKSGFIVAALTHPGDNWRDQSRSAAIEQRPHALGALVAYMTRQWPYRQNIDQDRVGAFGFSAGGFTVLVAAGGIPDMTRVTDHCAAHPDFFDCSLIKSPPRPTEPVHPFDAAMRFKAIVVAAPALGFTFHGDALDSVRIPVQLWRADDDTILPSPYYADAVRAALPFAADFHTVPKAGHFDFLAPCHDASQAPDICMSQTGFERSVFHERFNAEMTRFFKKTLGR